MVLAELFIAPDAQGQGIGAELLRRTLSQAERVGAKRKALITFTFNRVSQALYIRHGLFPRTPVYVLSGASDAVANQLLSAPLHTAPIAADDDIHLDAIDLAVLGVSRVKHHHYLATDTAMKGYLVHDDEDLQVTFTSTAVDTLVPLQ